MGDRLKDKIAIVTGAGSVGPGWGNGKAVAALFAREGAAIMALDIDAAALAETAAIIEGESGTVATMVCDVTQSDAIEATVAACLERFGRIDILHNNVGGSAPGGPVEMSEAAWQAQLDFNLTSVFLTCKHVLPVMERQRKGAIVNVSSIAGMRFIGNHHIGYAASKAGLIQFTKAIAIKYAALGIRANTVVPGLMHTPLVEVRLGAQYGAGDVDALIAKRNAQVPMGHMGDAWDVAYAALYLASDDAKYVTGAELVVDGGFVAKSV
ncbi:MAG: SDR family NAD(P)-dependent oxidoreductase [Proteobacteria bacterium]|nr:SDR family NAD(P)-dependent oxidoreductase [Pseudomonadota bacterium]